jgi:hypothetical protein
VHTAEQFPPGHHAESEIHHAAGCVHVLDVDHAEASGLAPEVVEGVSPALPDPEKVEFHRDQRGIGSLQQNVVTAPSPGGAIERREICIVIVVSQGEPGRPDGASSAIEGLSGGGIALDRAGVAVNRRDHQVAVAKRHGVFDGAFDPRITQGLHGHMACGGGELRAIQHGAHLCRSMVVEPGEFDLGVAHGGEG